MKIEFGAGETPTKKDFLQQDIRDVKGIDFVCAAWDIDKQVQDNTVDEIFSRHFFEHLTFKQGEYLLEVWHKILKENGRVEMMLPNMRLHVQQWLDKDKSAHFMGRALAVKSAASIAAFAGIWVMADYLSIAFQWIYLFFGGVALSIIIFTIIIVIISLIINLC